MMPSSWTLVRLGELATRTSNLDPARTPSENFELYSVPSFADGQPELVQGNDIKSVKQLVRPDDVLLCKIVPHINRVWVVMPATGRRQIASGEWIVFRDHGCDPHFLRHCLSERSFRARFMETVSGVGGSLMRARPSDVADIEVPLAPLSEQRRIVAKIDSLTGKSRRAREHLNHIPRLVEKYKQAVLAAAFRGDLTKEWRASNNATKAKHEPNSILEGSSATRSRVRKTAALLPDQISGKWEGPDGWRWSQVGDFAFVTKLAGFEYTKHVKYHASGDLRVIKAENAGPHGFRETDYSRVSSAAVAILHRSKLVGGELLVVFVGAGTGNVAVVPEADDFFLGPNIGMVRPTPEAASSRYLELFFRSAGGRELLLATSKAVAQPSLSMGAIRSTPVLLPPVAEQAEVVRAIEAAFAWIDRLASEATNARRLIDRLDQVVLAKAFRGELVPQDPEDEPASILLDRIRAERGAALRAKRGRKAKAA